MSKLPLTIASSAYDRIAALRDGSVEVVGCDVNYLVVPPEQLFYRALRSHEFDVSEISMSSYLMGVASGQSHYVAIPVFLSRVFRHSCIYIRTDRGIGRPADLKGLKVGVPEYQVTAALWARGLLEDEYGVSPSDLRWFTGGLHEPGRIEKIPLALPPSIRIEAIGPHQHLDAMLVDGSLDALITPRAPESFVSGRPDIGRLFPDYAAVERDYFKRTGIFPIMHVVGIRRELVERHPWLANSVFEAFNEAKRIAKRRLEDVAAHTTMLPWLGSNIEEAQAAMGDDYWPYGVDANRRVLEAMLGYAHRHGTLSRQLSIEDIFVPSTLDQFKV